MLSRKIIVEVDSATQNIFPIALSFGVNQQAKPDKIRPNLN